MIQNLYSGHVRHCFMQDLPIICYLLAPKMKACEAQGLELETVVLRVAGWKSPLGSLSS